jgi:drug/metabolite transporter (DMT)-like permease
MALGQDRLRPISGIALTAALLGLCLAIGFSSDSANLTGIGLASVAMVVTAFVILGNARAISEASALSVRFYMMLSAAISLTVLFAAFGTLALPHSALGWAGFVGVAIAATTGTLAFMGGMAFVGATRAAMISNLEPVLGVLFAIAALGEQVTLRQAIGIVIVLGSIFTMELDRYMRP